MEQKNTFRQGVTLIEALFVLGIMAILLGMVMVIYNRVSEREKINETRSLVFNIYNASNDLTSGLDDFGDLSTTVLIQSGLIDKKYINNGSFITPLGGSIITGNYGTGANSYSIWIYNLSKTACEEIVSQDWTGLTLALNVNWLKDSGGEAYTGTQSSQYCNLAQGNYIGINLLKR